MRRSFRIFLLCVPLLAIVAATLLLSWPSSPFRKPRTQFPPLAPRFPGGASACKADEDCGLTWYVDGECCGGNCGYGQAYRRAFIAALSDENGRYCEKGLCPLVECIEPPIEKHYRALCSSGACSLAIFSWPDARVARVVVLGDKVRVEFESKGLRIDVREDGLTYDGGEALRSYAFRRREMAAVLVRWRDAHRAEGDALLPSVAEILKREKVELRTVIDRLIAEVSATAEKRPSPPAASASSTRACNCPANDPLCSCL